MGLHFESSLAAYFAPQEPGVHQPELRQHYNKVMELVEADLQDSKNKDGCLKPRTVAAIHELPDSIRPKVPPLKLSEFMMGVLPKQVNDYLSGVEGCTLPNFAEECSFEYLAAGVSWKARSSLQPM
jgi:hypothetical protein